MSAITCQKCGARAQLHLCSTCERDLARMLTGLAVGPRLGPPAMPRDFIGPLLPGWIRGTEKIAAGFLEHLADAALGQTCLGASERRSNERGSPMPVPVGPNGDFSGSPSELYADICSMLGRWSAIASLGTETLAVERSK